MRKNLIGPIILGLMLLLSPDRSLGGESSYPAEVIKSLEASKDNRRQLERTLSHYASLGDSLKLEACLFLIGNMEGKSFVTYDLCDTAGQEIKFDALDYPDYSALESAWDTLEARYGTLDFKKKKVIYDLDTVPADLLTGHIDWAFKAWRQKPWAKKIPFDRFCEYVLPYRGSNEPLERWREVFWKKYKDLKRKMVNPSDPIEAARLINDDIKTWFSFDPRFYFHPTDQGLSEMLSNRKGRCEDMTNLTIYAMRANGIPVTSDYTPYWANAGNNHAWNAIITPEGKAIPFMGAEANPGEYHLANKLAKVYRKTFGKNKESLAFQERKQEKIPDWLSGKSFIDVSSDYTEVCAVTVAFKKEIPDSVDIAYLCVFNSGEWKPIHWGRVEEGKVAFTDMGTDIAHLPALYMNEKIVPFGDPFILHSDCRVDELVSGDSLTTSIHLNSIAYHKEETSEGQVARTFLTGGKEYELFYWKDGWQLLGSQVAGEAPLVFDEVPSRCLYWLVGKGSDREDERIFTIQDGKQVWW